MKDKIFNIKIIYRRSNRYIYILFHNICGRTILCLSTNNRIFQHLRLRNNYLSNFLLVNETTNILKNMNLKKIIFINGNLDYKGKIMRYKKGLNNYL